MLAERYQWTPDEVDALDPGYMDELLAFIAAQGVIKHKYRPKPRTRHA